MCRSNFYETGIYSCQLEVKNTFKYLINQKDITVNEAAVCSGVPPSTLKNILYGQSKNAGVVTIKKICDGLDVTIQEFFADPIFADLEPEL